MNVIDFESYRKTKLEAEKFETQYQQFIGLVNKFLGGIPKTFPSILAATYYCIRYLEGTINCLAILSITSLAKEDDLLSYKYYIINWLKELIKQVEDL